MLPYTDDSGAQTQEEDRAAGQGEDISTRRPGLLPVPPFPGCVTLCHFSPRKAGVVRRNERLYGRCHGGWEAPAVGQRRLSQRQTSYCRNAEQGKPALSRGFSGEWEIEADLETERCKRHRDSGWDSSRLASLQGQALGAQVTRGHFCGQNLGCVSSGGDDGRLGKPRAA